MKSITFLGFLFSLFSTQSSVYDIQVDTIEGAATTMAAFAGKKIIISPFNASSPDIASLHYLDSLQMSDTSLRVIAVPSNDFETLGNDTALAALKSSLSPNILMLKSTFVKKNAGDNQNPLFKWLTDVNENSHFDLDVLTEGQMFVVSGNGILYSVVDNDVPGDILNQILHQNVSQ